jgi:hypothetical protein
MAMRRDQLFSLCSGFAALCATSAAQAAPTVGPVSAVAPFAGHLFTPAPGQNNIGFWGTDMGFSFTHGNEIRFLFGDSWADPMATPIGTNGDDCVGTVSADPATGFATGAQVDSYAAARPPAWNQLPWQFQGPPLAFPVDGSNKIRPLDVKRGGPTGTAVGMQLLKTPLAGFSNGNDGAFVILSQAAPLECTGPSHSCPDGYQCDTGLGLCPYTLLPNDFGACVLGTLACNCQPTAGGGLCQDRTASWYDNASEMGRTLGVPLKYEVGNMDPADKSKIYSKTWSTNKFINVTTRTVQQWDPANPTTPACPPAGGVTCHDYRVASGSGSMRRVFMWGRPHVYGMKVLGHDAKLYFAYVDLPAYKQDASFNWAPQYYSAAPGQPPRFSPNPEDAQPLDLNGFPTATTEQWDITLFMSVSYIPTLDKWVMLYGGNESPVILVGGFGANAVFIQPDPQGAIHARFATNPWGPWSAPQQVLAGGDPNIVPPLLGSQYGPGGILHHDACIGPWCAPDEPATAYLFYPWGWLYAPEIVDKWTTPHGTKADIYFNVSTWAPYEIVLLKATLSP